MTQSEKMFVVKASTLKVGVTRANNLYCRMKGGAQHVHGTSDDFKNHQREVNAFIVESADEVAKCNHKEFGDIISFNVTFRTKKYEMVFVPIHRD
ncbi:hypothetical protein Tco_1046066 [Tanacetum coccineum]